jgi:hypothetical protein
MDMVNDNAFDYMDLFDKDMYTTISTSNCPDEPPIGYRFAWKLLKIIIHWPANDPEPRTQIFQSLCVFNYVKDYKKAKCYRGAEVPFVVKGDPKVAKTVKRWNTPHYVDALLGHVVKHDIDYTVTNHFLYWMKEGENPVTGSSLLSKCTQPTRNGWHEPMFPTPSSDQTCRIGTFEFLAIVRANAVLLSRRSMSLMSYRSISQNMLPYMSRKPAGKGEYFAILE